MSQQVQDDTDKKYGLINEVWPSNKGEKNIKNMKDESRKKYMEKLKYDSTPVKAKFRNFEPKGADHTLHYKKYGCEPLQTWRFQDGETYTIPLGLVEYVNETCRKSHNTLNNANGQPKVDIDQLQEFIPVSFS